MYILIHLSDFFYPNTAVALTLVRYIPIAHKKKCRKNRL